MVGVAGRSKYKCLLLVFCFRLSSFCLTILACHTCRRRRVKCDERHLTCERCEKGNHEYKGYLQKRVWINEVACTVQLERGARPWEYLENDTQSKVPHQEIPTAIGLAAFQHNIYVSFLLAKLFRGGVICISWNWLLNLAEDLPLFRHRMVFTPSALPMLAVCMGSGKL
jgi:hypothetical protein